MSPPHRLTMVSTLQPARCERDNLCSGQLTGVLKERFEPAAAYRLSSSSRAAVSSSVSAPRHRRQPPIEHRQRAARDMLDQDQPAVIVTAMIATMPDARSTNSARPRRRAQEAAFGEDDRFDIGQRFWRGSAQFSCTCNW